MEWSGGLLGNYEGSPNSRVKNYEFTGTSLPLVSTTRILLLFYDFALDLDLDLIWIWIWIWIWLDLDLDLDLGWIFA